MSMRSDPFIADVYHNNKDYTMEEMSDKFMCQSLQYVDNNKSRAMYEKYQIKLSKIIQDNNLKLTDVLNTSSKLGKDIAQLALDLNHECCTLIRKGGARHRIRI